MAPAIILSVGARITCANACGDLKDNIAMNVSGLLS